MRAFFLLAFTKVFGCRLCCRAWNRPAQHEHNTSTRYGVAWFVYECKSDYVVCVCVFGAFGARGVCICIAWGIISHITHMLVVLCVLRSQNEMVCIYHPIHDH